MSEKKYIQSIVRAIKMLNLFEMHKELKLSEISKMMSLNKTTAYGILDTLVHLRYLDKDEQTNAYRLGMGLFRISRHVDVDLIKICKPYLQKIVDQFEETVNLAVLDGSNLLYLDKIESPRSVRICTEAGLRIPIHCAAAGKAILAHLPKSKAAAIVSSLDFKPMTNNTITDQSVFLRELESIRQKGFALDKEEFEEGLLCIGVQLMDSRSIPAAAISVSTPCYRTNEERVLTIADTLVGVTREISDQISK